MPVTSSSVSRTGSVGIISVSGVRSSRLSSTEASAMYTISLSAILA